MGHIWDFFVDTMTALFIPLVCSYFAFSANSFMNMAARDATGLEWVGNALLSPVQYILAGKEALEKPDGSWELVQRFDYEQIFWVKATTSILALPPSLVLGSAVKGLSLILPKTRHRQARLASFIASKQTHSNLDLYRQMGLQIDSGEEYLTPLGLQRRPGDEKVLAIEKLALRDIGALLNRAQIPWWVDCGTCLGAYRYGGVIPWDGDIDIAVLLPDFENVRHALNELDPKQYIVQDWSSRKYPDSYLKVFIRQTRTLIDVYHFAMDPVAKELRYILSLEENLFFPEWWKIRERRFKVPVAFDTVFPLKRALLDGIEVFVPNQIKPYLQRCYGENLDPAKVYDPVTGNYEKDLTHPYWQRVHAH
jgi:hypothetical protein